jgi:hypothetical protein
MIERLLDIAYISLAAQFCGGATPPIAQRVKEIDTVKKAFGHGRVDAAPRTPHPFGRSVAIQRSFGVVAAHTNLTHFNWYPTPA